MPLNVFSPVAREGLFFGSVASLLLLAVIIMLSIRTLSLPGCMKCGFRSVRRAKSHKMLDNLARLLFLRPYRCGKCLRRFYGFRSHRVTSAAGYRAEAGA